MIPQPFAPPPSNHFGAMDDKYAREWWRWSAAIQIAAGIRARATLPPGTLGLAARAIEDADALIAELERGAMSAPATREAPLAAEGERERLQAALGALPGTVRAVICSLEDLSDSLQDGAHHDLVEKAQRQIVRLRGVLGQTAELEKEREP